MIYLIKTSLVEKVYYNLLDPIDIFITLVRIQISLVITFALKHKSLDTFYINSISANTVFL